MLDTERYKTVLIPIVSMAAPTQSQILELLVKPGSLGLAGAETRQLVTHGLSTAVSAANKALECSCLDYSQETLILKNNSIRTPRRPALYVRNPIRAISNASGAALGIALGIIMFNMRWPCSTIIATGRFDEENCDSSTCVIPSNDLEGQLMAALYLGLQKTPLPFFVPANLSSGDSVADVYRRLITELSELSIVVIPVSSLENAGVSCEHWANGSL